MVHIPSVEELRTMTDEAMIEHGVQRGTPEWTQNWEQWRNELLNTQTNRIYWEENPDAPLKIEEDNPDHDRYQKSWWAIHEQILGNAPPPVDQDSFAVDLSTIGFRVKQWIAVFQQQLQDREIYDDFEQWSNGAIDEVIQAYNGGSLVVGQAWTGTVATFALRAAPHGLEAWTSSTMKEDGSVETEVKSEPDIFTLL